MMKIERRPAAKQAAPAAPSASVALSACPLIPLQVAQFIYYSHTDEDDDEDEDESWWTMLPEDIVVEILLRLPIKPLFKLKSISKQYESIISGQEFFAERYMQRVWSSLDARSLSGIKVLFLYPMSRMNPFGFSKKVRYLTDSLSQDEEDESSSISVCHFSPIPKDEMNHMVASSNGLILSCFFPCNENTKPSRFILRVSNPLTKQWAPIPESVLNDIDEVGFGIATRCGAYKIVLIQRVLKHGRLVDNADTSVEIFCSVTGRWATWEVRRCPAEVYEKCTGSAVFSYKGVLYWLGRGTGTVITYDPFDNPGRFGRIPVPEQRYPHLGYRSLIYSGDQGRVKYCEMDKGGGGSGFDRLMVWRLVVNDNPEWCMEGEFCFPSLHHPCSKLMVSLNPCEPDIVCHPYVKDCKLMVVNLRTRTWTLVDVIDPNTGPYYFRRGSTSVYPEYLPFIHVEVCPWSSPFYKIT